MRCVAHQIPPKTPFLRIIAQICMPAPQLMFLAVSPYVHNPSPYASDNRRSSFKDGTINVMQEPCKEKNFFVFVTHKIIFLPTATLHEPCITFKGRAMKVDLRLSDKEKDYERISYRNKDNQKGHHHLWY